MLFLTKFGALITKLRALAFVTCIVHFILVCVYWFANLTNAHTAFEV